VKSLNIEEGLRLDSENMEEDTTFKRLRHALIELLRGYPEYMFWGKFESYLKSGKKSVEILNNHQIIEKISLEEVKKKIAEMSEEERKKLPTGEDRFLWYRLTAKGVDLAISIINLEYSDKFLKYTRETHEYNKRLRWVTIILGVFTCASVIIELLQLLS